MEPANPSLDAAESTAVRSKKSTITNVWYWQLPKVPKSVIQGAQDSANLNNLSTLSTLAFSTPPGPISNLSNIEGAQVDLPEQVRVEDSDESAIVAK